MQVDNRFNPLNSSVRQAWIAVSATRYRQAGGAPLWLLIVLGILGGLWLYWYTTPQSIPTWAQSWIPGLPEYTGPLYRWRDNQGREQMTDKPPKDRVYEQMIYRSNTNVIPAKKSLDE
ncbi:MAG: DUF4124 domain-containing protein [Candidatus Competibacteraceae bacterium]|nr:DUF4124 domain-containing protein [Candidatus Competibacteraceae bacterium]